ncbi:MAG: phage PBSX transcriptional regulator [uncultured bacterium]|nr:MAG: phage PBSX transcriptional regulator [uncultured bacterium]
MKIGNQIKTIRNNVKQTQNEFAKNIGVSKSTLSGYENNLSNPSIKILLKIAETYGLTVDYILTGKNNLDDDNSCRITDKHLLFLTEKIDHLPKTNKDKIKSVIEALLKE